MSKLMLWMSTVAIFSTAACTGTEPTDGEPAADAAKEPKEGPQAPPDVAQAPSDAQSTASGLKYKTLAPGTGADHPGPHSRVNVRYTVWTPDGTMVETNTESGPHARISGFSLLEVPLPFMREALQEMMAGGKARFWVPAEQAYGGRPGKPEGPITVDLELVNVVNPPAAPPDVASVPADATKTASGLAYKVIKPGNGDETPSRWSRVTVSFTGWQADGKVIDSTVSHGRPQMYKLTEGAMEGWIEGLQLMHRRETVRFWIPESLTYKGAEDKPKGTLVYDVELISFDNPVPPPDDVAAPPPSASKTASGLAYQVLQKGKGGKHPDDGSIVEVNYTGWTTDGNMFDSTSKRNKPMRFAATQVIPGWTEGLKLMTAGEKTRFWIPKELAYNDQQGKPQGMLVFDVELVSFEAGPSVPADLAAPPADARKSESGVAVKTLKPGAGGESPIEGAKVEVHYTGWTASDSKMFDSTTVRGEPAKFPLSGAVPKGLVEGLGMMTKGEKARLWVPAELAQSSRPGGPQGALVFDIELIDFSNPPPPLPAPPDVSAPPADATKTASGLAYKVLQKGTGTAHPGPTQRVKVHYSGWTASDGKMFDSSVQRGEPASFALNGVIKGWTEGLQLMVVGEKTRFWIPGELAYGDRPGRPQGMLVFDVELLEIVEGESPRMLKRPELKHPNPPPQPPKQ